MEREAFDRTYAARLNAQQREAVHAVEGAVLLLAVPGSGKTSVLVTRLGYMLCCCGIAPERILTMTYTVAATKEMGQRFRALFGAACPRAPEFRTINGVSAKIIEQYSRTHGSGAAFSLLDDEGALAQLIAELVQELGGAYPTQSDVKEIRRTITYVKNQMLGQEEIEALDTGIDRFPELFARYCAELRKRRCMDYDDQMVYAKTILECYPDVREAFQTRYPYICVDEAQDTSKIQHALIRLLAQKSGNLFLVGDEDQSIYGFRAAYPEALMRFERDYPGARVLLMEENYRSTPEILRAADAFIRKNTARRPKTIRPTRPSGAAVHVIETVNREAQLDYLLDAAQSGSGTPAVLYRNNDSALPLIDLLDRRGIPYRCRQMDDTFFTHRMVADLRDIVRLAHDGRDAACFLRIYSRFGVGITRKAAEAACERSAASGKPILRELLGDAELSRYTRESLTGLIEGLDCLPEDSAEAGLRRIWGALRYHIYAENQKLDVNKFAVLCLLARPERSPDSLLERLEQLRALVTRPQQPEAPRLLLSTIHSSKGLEYDTVYLLDAADTILPSVPAPKTGEERRQHEEERRLFYVAMTRAKNELFLFRCLDRDASFVDEVRRTLPQEMPDELFAALPKALCGKRYTHAVRGTGTVIAQCEGHCLIAYPDGTREALTVGQMYDRRLIRRSAPQPAEAKPERPAVVPIETVRPGSRILHRTFGAGAVVRVLTPYIEIEFPSDGVKKFVFSDAMRLGLLYFDEKQDCNSAKEPV